MINSQNGAIKAGDGFVSGYQQLQNNTCVYLYVESDIAPLQTGILVNGKLDTSKKMLKAVTLVPFCILLTELKGKFALWYFIYK